MLEQERLFAAGKLALLRDALDAAIAPLTAGLGCAQEWRRHFRRELGHACGLCDLDAAATHYAARRCQNWCSATFGALAVHHERGAPAVAAARSPAAAAFERERGGGGAAGGSRRRAVRLARAREGSALGEVDGGGGAAVLFGPERAAPSAAAYAKAVAVDESAAAYEGLGRALLGVPRGTRRKVAAGAERRRGEALRAALALTPAEADSDGWRRSSPSSTKRAATWRAGGGGRRAAGGGGGGGASPRRRAPPGWAPMFDGAPAVDVARTDDIMALVAAGRPALPELKRRRLRAGGGGTAEALAGGALGGRVVKVSTPQSGRFDGPERGFAVGR